MSYPTNPTAGDTYILSGKTWKYDGANWVKLGLSRTLSASVAFSDLTSTPTTLSGYGITDGGSGDSGGGGGSIEHISTQTASSGAAYLTFTNYLSSSYSNYILSFDSLKNNGANGNYQTIVQVSADGGSNWLTATSEYTSPDADTYYGLRVDGGTAAEGGGANSQGVSGFVYLYALGAAANTTSFTLAVTPQYNSSYARKGHSGHGLQARTVSSASAHNAIRIAVNGSNGTSTFISGKVSLLGVKNSGSGGGGGGGGGSLSNIVEDTTPQLGGNLDAQTFDITTTGKILYANMYATEGDLPSATTYHGMFAHVHATGAGYFAHAGNWVKLANHTDLSSGSTVPDVVFPSDWGSPTNTYSTSGTWSKGSLADDAKVWFFLLGGGQGAARRTGGRGGSVQLIYGTASQFDGAAYVVGAGVTGQTTEYWDPVQGNQTTLTLSSSNGSRVFTTGVQSGGQMNDAVSEVIKEIPPVVSGTYLNGSPKDKYNITKKTLPSGYQWFFGMGVNYGQNIIFGGALGQNNYGSSTAASTSLLSGNGGASVGANGTYPGGGGAAGDDTGQSGNGAAGNVRVYHV